MGYAHDSTRSAADGSPPSEPRTRDPLPDGWYRAKIVSAAHKPTQNGGSGINLKWEVTSEPGLGRWIFQWINVEHATNAECAARGKGELDAICRATGIVRFSHERELIGGEADVDLGYQPAQGTYDAANKVKGVRAPSLPKAERKTADRPAAPQSGPPRDNVPPADSYNDDDIPF